MKTISLFFAVGVLFTFSSCSDENPIADIPFRYVHEEINLGSIQYQELWNLHGYIYLNAGYKGIIVINQGANVYSAFERACTHDPKEDCSIIEMDESELFLIDHCCGSTFDLLGNPTGGPASVPLIEYRTFIENGDILIISNE